MGRSPDPALAFMPYPDAEVRHVPSGPLAGLRLAVKDLFDVAGYPTSGGSPILLAMSGLKAQHAASVERLLAAGALFVGKTVTDEFAFSLNGNNAHFGAPINSAAPDRITGGSSSGSAAAVAAGLCEIALGSDTGGSVRGPASHCGLIGIRPSHGRVSLEGCLPLSPSLDTCGWFASDIDPFERTADCLLGQDASPLPRSPRLLWPDDLWSLADAGAAAALQTATARVVERVGPARHVSVVLESADRMYWSFRFIQGREAWLADGALIDAWRIPLGPGVAERFTWARTVSDDEHQAALQYRQDFSRHLDHLLGTDGVLVLPTMPDVAPLRAAPESALEDYRNRAIRLLCPAGLAGLPQISLPMVRHGGAPIGLSLIGPRGSDRSLVQLAAHMLKT